MHQAVIAQLAARRTGTHDTKTRGEVCGGGAKPYRQKGTGRARQGSRRAPHYAGGGVVFGPHPRSYEQRLPKRMKRLALHGALTSKFDDGAIRVVDELGLDGAQDERAASATSTRSRPAAGSCVVANGRRREPGAVGAQPARRDDHSRRLAQRGRRPERGHAAHHAAVAVDDGGGVRMTLQAAQIVAAPGHQREVDGRDAARQVHVRGPRRRQQAADQGRDRGALQGQRASTSTCSTTKAKEKSRNRRRGRIKGWTIALEEGRRDRGQRPRRSNSSRGSSRCRCAATSRPPRAAVS